MTMPWKHITIWTELYDVMPHHFSYLGCIVTWNCTKDHFCDTLVLQTDSIYYRYIHLSISVLPKLYGIIVWGRPTTREGKQCSCRTCETSLRTACNAWTFIGPQHIAH